MRKIIIQVLLNALNSRLLNASPCRYGFIGNVDAFSYENLESEEKQRPGVTIRTILEEADRFRCCPIGKDGLTVLESDGTSHDASVWEMHELRQALAPRQKE